MFKIVFLIIKECCLFFLLVLIVNFFLFLIVWVFWNYVMFGLGFLEICILNWVSLFLLICRFFSFLLNLGVIMGLVIISFFLVDVDFRLFLIMYLKFLLLFMFVLVNDSWYMLLIILVLIFWLSWICVLFLNYWVVGLGVFVMWYFNFIGLFFIIFSVFKGWVNCGVIFFGFFVFLFERN